MYCEDYAEIVENEEGDYSRYLSVLINQSICKADFICLQNSYQDT